jgi:hypothetical protein
MFNINYNWLLSPLTENKWAIHNCGYDTVPGYGNYRWNGNHYLPVMLDNKIADCYFLPLPKQPTKQTHTMKR